MDYSVCSGSTGQKSIVCSACHGGAITADIFIIDGKLEDESSEEETTEETYVIEITLPVEEGQSVQLFSSGLDETSRLNGPQGNELGELQIKESSVLYNVLALNNFRVRGQNFARLNVELFTSNIENQGEGSFILQGVISNNDGTPNGDQSFYQEIALPKKQLNTKLKSETKMYFANNALNIDAQNNLLLSIFNLNGQEVFQLDNTSSGKVDLSFLPNGMYIAMAQGAMSEQVNFKFVKK